MATVILTEEEVRGLPLIKMVEARNEKYDLIATMINDCDNEKKNLRLICGEISRRLQHREEEPIVEDV